MEKLKLYGKKDEGEREFLGTIYVNEKKEVVINIKDPQVKEDIFQEINEKLRKQSGILLELKPREVDEEDEKSQQELGKKLRSLFEEDKEIKEYVEDLKNLWRERIRLSIEKEKLLNKKGIEAVEKEIKEIEEKIHNKIIEEEFYERLIELERECYGRRALSTLRTFSALGGLGIERPGAPLFLAALRSYLLCSRKKYGRYVLTRPFPIVEDKSHKN